MINKKALAIALLILMLVVSFAPFAYASYGNETFQSPSLKISSISNSGNRTVVVYVPSNQSSLTNILESYLGKYGISLHLYGSLANFNLPENNYSSFMTGFSSLSERLHLNYFVSNGTSNFVPFLSYANITGSQGGVPFAYSPSDIANAYNFVWAQKNNLTGKGITLVIVDAYGDPNLLYDVSAFDNRTGLPPIDLKVMYPTGPVGAYNKSWAIETSTDVEWAHAMAPGAKIVLMVSQNANTTSLEDAVSYAVSNHVGNIISLSWGISESQLGHSEIATLAGVYLEAANEGITVLAATGDNGAYDGSNSLTVNFPSSDPFVTAVGGTSLFSSSGSYTERAWGGVLNGKSYGSGGGYSSFFSKPYWQIAPGMNSSQRGTPDVSLDANPDTGMIVISQGQEYKVGGTSIATPIWCDVLAIISQYLGQDLGFTTPLLYQIATSGLYKSAFYDIVLGQNGYYYAATGWDPVTGLGTPNVEGLAMAFKSILNPYGALAEANGTNAYSINTTLTIQGNPSVENFNGSSFYYLSLYDNATNFVKFGVSADNNTLSYKYVIEQNGTEIQNSYLIGAFSEKAYVFDLNLSYSGNNITMKGNNFDVTVNAFLTFIGSAQAAFGAEQTNSMTNLTELPSATFSRLGIVTANGSEAPPLFYESHYQGISGERAYSTISIAAESGGQNFAVSYSKKQTNGIIFGSTAQPPAILYTLSYWYHPTGTFYVSGFPASSISWKVNNNGIKGNAYTFNSPGHYNITAVLGGVASANRMIYIPNVYESQITANSDISYYKYPEVNLTVNSFYNYGFSDHLIVPTIFGENSIKLSSKGFYVDSRDLSGGNSTTVTLTPMNVSVSLFAFPGNAEVSINGASIPSYRGEHITSISPQTISIIVSESGYHGNSTMVSLLPGQNYSLQFILSPDSASHYIDGYVSDKEYSFPIYQANVSVENGPYAYTNSTGFYVVFMKPGVYTLNYSSPLYQSLNRTFDITNNSLMVNIGLTPKQVNVSNIPTIKITKSIPILFFLGFVSWTKYNGGNFQSYQVYYSTNQSMLDPNVITIGSQSSTYTLITGIFPMHTYYVTVVIHLTDGQVYSSPEVQMGYSNLVYLFVNIAILAGIIVYLYFAVGFLRRASKRRKF